MIEIEISPMEDRICGSILICQNLMLDVCHLTILAFHPKFQLLQLERLNAKMEGL